jgi:hypothetical protein
MTRAVPLFLLVAALAVAAVAAAGPAGGAPARHAAAGPDGGVGTGTLRPSPARLRTRVVRGSGDVRPAVNRFRRRLGPNNGGAPGGRARGRREIDWDAVPDALAAPHALPGDFFNAAAAPRARGAVLATPGDHVAVSADAANPDGAAVRFGDVNPSYPDQFRTFSAERLFSPIGSNVVNLRFRVPGTRRRAVVRGFGAVYTDVDRREGTSFRYYDARGRLLGSYAVPVSRGGLSFLGVRFPRAVVARVRIEYGSATLGPDDGARYDVAVMDDFIYGEPRAVRR